MNKSISWVLISSLLCSCSDSEQNQIVPEPGPTTQQGPQLQEGTALFDYFNYKGHDACFDNLSLGAGDFLNPVLPGWYSDPSVCSNGKGDYYLIASSFAYFPGVPLFHSRDLVNWKQINNIISRDSQLDNIIGQDTSGGIFAPAIDYNPHNDTYYMITCNIGKGCFLVKAKDPAGEWSDPIYLDNVYGIDPSLLFDDDGKAYIVVCAEAPDNKEEYGGHHTVRIIEYDTETDRTVGDRKIIVNKGSRPSENPIWCEGPHLYKIKGKYYLITAEGGSGDWHSEVVYKSPAPFGPYVAYDKNPILTQRMVPWDREYPISEAGHADIIEGPDGQWWGFFLGRRPVNQNYFENLGRETFMYPVEWTEDGWPFMTGEIKPIPKILNIPGVTVGENPTFGNFERHYTFDEEKLDFTWMSLRRDITSYYSLTRVPGYLALDCQSINVKSKDAPSYLGRRVQHHSYEVSTRMGFNSRAGSEAAGLLIYKDEKHQYFFAKGLVNNQPSLFLSEVSPDGEKNVAVLSLPETNEYLDLKIVSDGSYYDFYYSFDNGENWEWLAKHVSAFLTSSRSAGGFTGTTVGIYATSNK